MLLVLEAPLVREDKGKLGFEALEVGLGAQEGSWRSDFHWLLAWGRGRVLQSCEALCQGCYSGQAVFGRIGLGHLLVAKLSYLSVVVNGDKAFEVPATEASEPSEDGLALLDLSSESQQICGDRGDRQEANLVRSLFGDAYISLQGGVGIIEDKGLDRHGNWWGGVDVSKYYGTRTSDAW